jgi:hypothetical protein
VLPASLPLGIYAFLLVDIRTEALLFLGGLSAELNRVLICCG